MLRYSQGKKCSLCIFPSHQVRTCFTYFSFSLSEHPPSHPFAPIAFSSPSPLTVEREIDCLTISLSLSFLLVWTACSHLWITLLCIVELLNSTSSLFSCTRLLSLKQDTLTNVEKRGNKHNNEKLHRIIPTSLYSTSFSSWTTWKGKDLCNNGPALGSG